MTYTDRNQKRPARQSPEAREDYRDLSSGSALGSSCMPDIGCCLGSIIFDSCAMLPCGTTLGLIALLLLLIAWAR